MARRALAALAARPGCRGGTVGRNADNGSLWVLATTWESVGAYRRALSAYDVKLHAVPLMYRALDEPTAFEHLVTAENEFFRELSASERQRLDRLLDKLIQRLEQSTS